MSMGYFACTFPFEGYVLYIVHEIGSSVTPGDIHGITLTTCGLLHTFHNVSKGMLPDKSPEDQGHVP